MIDILTRLSIEAELAQQVEAFDREQAMRDAISEITRLRAECSERRQALIDPDEDL